MHKLYEYICDELKDLEKKAEKGNLSMQEIQYGDTLAHFKKNLMAADEMMEDEYGEYSMAYYPMTSYAEEGRNRGGNRMGGRRASYARRRDAMGRYSRAANEDTLNDLHEIMAEAKDGSVKSEIKKLIDKLEMM